MTTKPKTRKGMAKRAAAQPQLTGVSHTTVNRQLSGTDVPKSGTHVPLAPIGEFETIVIDPPWPMTKIERDARPNQAGFSYPTMGPQENIFCNRNGQQIKLNGARLPR